MSYQVNSKTGDFQPIQQHGNIRYTIRSGSTTQSSQPANANTQPSGSVTQAFNNLSTSQQNSQSVSYTQPVNAKKVQPKGLTQVFNNLGPRQQNSQPVTSMVQSSGLTQAFNNLSIQQNSQAGSHSQPVTRMVQSRGSVTQAFNNLSISQTSSATSIHSKPINMQISEEKKHVTTKSPGLPYSKFTVFGKYELTPSQEEKLINEAFRDKNKRCILSFDIKTQTYSIPASCRFGGQTTGEFHDDDDYIIIKLALNALGKPKARAVILLYTIGGQKDFRILPNNQATEDYAQKFNDRGSVQSHNGNFHDGYSWHIVRLDKE